MRKRRQPVRQVWTKKASESEPLMTYRNRLDGIKTGLRKYGPGRARGKPVYCPDGARYGGGASLAQALAWNVGTRRPGTDGQLKWVMSAPWPSRGRASRGGNPEGQSTDLGHGDGLSRSSGEGPVMGLERRGRVTLALLMANRPWGGMSR